MSILFLLQVARSDPKETAEELPDCPTTDFN